AEAVAWLASDQGREFVGLSSDDWGRASVAAGTDPEAAAAAAERTRAAYTGDDAAAGQDPGS
ncbi:MAG TPA: hypothetical protein VF263_12930, partial [Longimicrobiaceae bacterium]